jgi:hypothetical protein
LSIEKLAKMKKHPSFLQKGIAFLRELAYYKARPTNGGAK